MDEIIKNIKEAEEKAAEIKAEAYKRAEVVLENAEKQAAEIAASNEAECKALKESAVKKAEAEADRLYRAETEKKRAESKKYADELSAKTDGAVTEVVRRILSGSC